MVGCGCPVELRMAKRVVFFFPYTTVVLLFVVFVPLVESGICLLVDVATLSTIYDVRHPLLLPPAYPTQELISRPQAVRPPSSTPPRLPQERKEKKNATNFPSSFRYAYPSSSLRCSRKRPSLLSLACASGRLSFAVGERYYCVYSFLQSLSRPCLFILKRYK